VPTDAIQPNVDEVASPANPASAPPRRRRWLAWLSLDGIAKALDLVRKITVSLAVTALLVGGFLFVGREVTRDRIIIEPVAVQVEDTRSGLTPASVGEEVLRYFALIQRVGAGEWQQFYIDAPSTSSFVGQANSILNQPINLKELGAPLNVTTSIGEIASALGIRHPTIKISISSRRHEPGFVGSVTMSGRIEGRATCEAWSAQSAEEIVECVALSAMSLVDPKIAAAYVFQSEARNCRDFGSEFAGPDAAHEARRISMRRDRCAFARTQRLIANVLDRRNAEDRYWVPYIFGRIHSARATALAGVDRAQQLGELDQAIGRFVEARHHNPDSIGPIAVLIDAYVRKGVSMHERTVGLPWSDDPTSPLQWHLLLAESTFKDAQETLREIPERRSVVLDARVTRLEGHLAYRRWLLMAHQRTKSGQTPVAMRQPAELALLSHAAARYASAAGNGEASAAFLMEWGNILRAMGRFDEAVEKYGQAADRVPADVTPRLLIANTYLDKVAYADAPVDHLFLLIALGASADYLSWASNGGPYPNLISRIGRALGQSGYVEDSLGFESCMASGGTAPTSPIPAALSDDPQTSMWLQAATLKVCVDRAIDVINKRVIAEDRRRNMAARP
jgi:tetratricopeptide (TPR) repeat protein